MQTTYRNLVTSQPAQPAEYKRDFFELEILAQTTGYRYATSEGEFLCAYASEPTFWAAYYEAILSTTIGGAAYKTYRDDKADEAEALTQQWAEQQGPFDPYAGSLDELLGY